MMQSFTHTRAAILAACGGAILVVAALAYLFASHRAGIAGAPTVIRGQDGGENEERATLTHQRGNVVLNIASGRPLASAARELMREYGYAISYEDPRYENANDLVDISAEVREDGKSGAQDSRYALWVPITRRAVIVLPEPRSQADIGAALSKVASAFGDAGGRFEIERAPGIVHVIPRGIRDRNGNWSNPGSVLDTRISIPKAPRSDSQLIQAICDAVSQPGLLVTQGMGMGGGLMSSRGPPLYELGAENERARDVLTTALRLIGRDQLRQTWFLFYGSFPTDDSYAMNFLPVPDRTPVGAQRPVNVPHSALVDPSQPSYWHN